MDDFFNPAIQIVSILSKPSVFFQEPVRLVSNVEQLDTSPDNNDNSSSNNSRVRNEEEATYRPVPFHILIGSEETLTTIAGFPVARGAMACGIVPTRDEEWVFRFLQH